MARVKHIAIRTVDVEKTAAFYRDAFGLEQIGKAQNGIYLTDGYLNIAVLKMRPAVEGETMKLGLDHFGFQVDNIDSAVAQIQRLGGRSLSAPAQGTPQGRSDAQSYFEVKCVGPDQQVFDVSSAGWAGAK